jgi:ABC-2 type transport system ATP-binding protein
VNASPVFTGRDVRKVFRRDTGDLVQALDGITVEANSGSLTALVGPDGAGKTTLIRLIAGLMKSDGGTLTVLGIDASAHPQQIQDRIGYMPQKFGLYEDLTVQENLDLYADLHGVPHREREPKYAQLMEMTALGPFKKRLAGQLSGGMKQKLGLACTLVRTLELLLLDEPTVGVDPLSRRELWEIIHQLVDKQGLTVLLSTSYLDEAERCGHVIVLHEGKVLDQGPPQRISALANGRTFLATPPAGTTARGLQSRLIEQREIVDAVPEGGLVRLVTTKGTNPPAIEGVNFSPVPPRFESGFMILLRKAAPQEQLSKLVLEAPLVKHGQGPIVRVQNLVRRFGRFTAVDHVSFEVQRGEIYGLLGPNGAGKTTTFRMLCGLLAATEGTLEVAGVNVLDAPAPARQRLGYVAQKFSLYGQLSVIENLEFFAGAYGLRGRRRQERIRWALQQFELTALSRVPSGQLPDGQKKRLVMAAAMLHEPEILFLDEPTSGADPGARREFWRRITALAEQDVTVIVTTHFMEEAEYCDRVAILDAGRILAQGTPAEIRRHAHAEAGREPNMEDAFIAIVEESRHKNGAQSAGDAA